MRHRIAVLLSTLGPLGSMPGFRTAPDARSGRRIGAVAVAAGALLLAIAGPALATPPAWQRHDIVPAGGTATDWYAPGWYSSLAFDSAGRPHVAYRGKGTDTNPIMYAYYDGTTWRGEASSTAPDNVSSAVGLSGRGTGYLLSLALDPSGNPHIAFSTTTSSVTDTYQLRYASWTGSAWVKETIEFGPQYQLAPSSWTGMFPSLVIDLSGTPHVSYIDCWAATDARTCAEGLTGGTHSATVTETTRGDAVTNEVQTLVVDATGGTFRLRFAGVSPGYYWTGNLAYNITAASLDAALEPVARTQFGLASNSDALTVTGGPGAAGGGTPYVITFQDGLALRDVANLERVPPASDSAGNGTLKYATKVGSEWVVTTLAAAAPDVSIDGNTSLALDASGTPHIAYLDRIGWQLMYASLGSGGWTTGQVAATAGYNASLAFAGNLPRIAYTSNGGALKYAVSNGSAWSQVSLPTINVANFGTGDMGPDLRFDASGVGHFAYIASNSGAYTVSHGWFDTTGFHSEWVSTPTAGDWYPSLALDANGQPGITYFNRITGTTGPITYASLAKATSSIVLNCPTSATYTGSPITCDPTVVGSGGLSQPPDLVTYASNVDAGTASVTATFYGDETHYGTRASATFEIGKAPTITVVSFEAAPYTYRGTAFTATAAATGPGLDMSLTPEYTGDCTNVTSLDGCSATASYPGDVNHEVSTDTRSITIERALVTATAGGGAGTYTGTAQSPSACVISGDYTGDLTCANDPASVGPDVSTVTINPVVSGTSLTNFAITPIAGAYTIDPAATTTVVTCPDGPFTFTGSAIEPCSATVTGPELDQSLTVAYTDDTNAGTATAAAGFAEAGNYLGSGDSKTFTIDPAATTTVVTCPDGPFTFTGSPIEPCSAAVSGAGGLDQALVVGYTDNTNVGTATAAASWPEADNYLASNDSKTFTIDPAPVTVIAGTGSGDYSGVAQAPSACVVTGDYVGDLTCANDPASVGPDVGAYPIAPVVNGTGLANFAITPIAGAYTIDPAVTTTVVTCTAGPFAYSSDPIAPCTASVTGPGGLDEALIVAYTDNTNAGEATASATFAAGGNYRGSDDSTTFIIDPAATTTIVTCDAGPFTYTGDAQTPCAAAATGPGGLDQSLTVGYEGNTNAGTATASAAFTAGGNYLGSSDSAPFTIDPAPSTTIASFEIGPYVYRGTAFTATARVTGVGGLDEPVAVTYGGDCTNVTSSDGCTASAEYLGDTNHYGSSGGTSITIAQASTVTVVSCTSGPFTFNGAPIEPCSASVTGAGGLDETLVVAYSDNVHAGTATGNAAFSGDTNHTGSTDARTFSIDPALTTTIVTCTAGPFIYGGEPIAPCTASVTGPGGLDEALDVDYTDNTNAGVVTASAAFTGDADHVGSADTTTFTIDRAPSTTVVTFEAGPYVYRGTAFTATAHVTGPGGLDEALTVGYGGDCTNVTAGGCTASAAYLGDANHDASSDLQGITIDPAATTTVVTFESGPYVYRASAFTATAKVTGPGGLDQSLAVSYGGDCINVSLTGGCSASASYAGDSNHDGSTDATSITIEKAPSTTVVTFEAGPYVYRGTAFTATARVTGVGGLNQALTIDYGTTDCTHVTSAGCTAAASYAGDTNHEGSSDSRTIHVTKASLTVTATDQGKAYGEPNPPLTFVYSGFVNDEGQSALDTKPTCSTTATQYSPVAGSPYPITCSGGADGDYAFSYVPGHLTIARAEALVSYVGETVFVSSGANSSTVQANLTATLQAVDEDYALGTATVSFVDETTGKVLAANVPVTPVDGHPNVGTANVRVTLSTGQYGSELYSIQIVATGNYANVQQSDADKTVNVVAMKPAVTNTTVGGGTIDPLAPAGTYRGDPDGIATFNIALLYNNKGANLQGKVTLSIPQADGSIVYVKATSLSSMSVVVGSTGKTSTIYAKAVVIRLFNGVFVQSDGNATLRVDVFEPGSQDPAHAQVGFTALSKSGALYYSNNWLVSGSGKNAVWKTVVQALLTGSVDIN